MLRDSAAAAKAEYVFGGTPLHEACRHDNEPLLRFLLDEGWKCNKRDKHRRTALHDATRHNFVAGVELFLAQSDCDIDAIDELQYTVLHYARSVEVVDMLLRKGAKNDEMNYVKQTPLFLAVYRGDDDVVSALLQSTPKPDVHTTDHRGWNLLHAAYDNESLTKLLLKEQVSYDAMANDGSTPLWYAVINGCSRTAKTLIDAGADPNKNQAFVFSFLQAIFSQSTSSQVLEMLQILGDAEIDFFPPDSHGTTVLHRVVRYTGAAKTDMFEYIVGKVGSCAGNYQKTDLYMKILCECFAACVDTAQQFIMAKVLCTRGCLDVIDTGLPGLNVLQYACSHGNLPAVTWILEHGARVNELSGPEGTALCAAVKSQTADAAAKVSWLLAKGADINLSNPDQPTPLQLAAAEGKADVLSELLNHELDVDLVRGCYDPPLLAMITRENISLAIIKRLISKGVDTRKPSQTGHMAIHIAAASDRVGVFTALKKGGADVTCKDAHGRTPLMYALIGQSYSITKHLLSAEAFNILEVNSLRETGLIAASILGDETMLSSLLNIKSDNPTHSAFINAQDKQGKTALMHAACRDNLPFVRKLLSHGADTSILDCRGKSALYWGARQSRLQIVDLIMSDVYDEMQDHSRLPDVAVHGAIASDKRGTVGLLLEHEEFLNLEYAMDDEWTPLYTARRYQSKRMEQTIVGGLGHRPAQDKPRKRPGAWHVGDMHPGIQCDPSRPLKLTTQCLNLLALRRKKNVVTGSEGEVFGTARSDYPMVPIFKERIYYFEIKLTKVQEKGCLAVGFCEDIHPIDRHLGWEPGSWGFHSGNGCLYQQGKHNWRGLKYSTRYQTKDTIIGCGVNFEQNSAFFTVDGKIIGRAFQDIRGKLYPAISFDIGVLGWEIDAVFPDKNGECPDFAFKGDLEDPDTLKDVGNSESEEDQMSSLEDQMSRLEDSD
ncbi:ankyrin repeat-containing domain protein [Xylaria palmicola]|nr:ankyrin repeat-containing domain protein [Xylaria palmicola]